MKVALAQINPTIGDFDGNVAKILDAARRAHERGAELVVFSELCIPGYPPMDLLESKDFVRRNLDALDRVVRELPDIAAAVGFVDRAKSEDLHQVHNAAAFIGGGQIRSVHYKTLLPTYDVFDEDRYFEKAKDVQLAEFAGKRIGVSICEDIWNNKEIVPHRVYTEQPVARSAEMGADFFINLSASPYSMEKAELRLNMIRAAARKHKKKLIYVNQVGGNDQLIFDGASVALDENGNILAQARDFEEDLVLVDLETGEGEMHEISETPVEAATKALCLGLRDYVHKCRFRSVVLGLSGGIDSAVTAAIAARALGPENVHGILMPGPYSSDHSISDAETLAKNLGIHYRTIPIKPMFETFIENLRPAFEGKAPDTTEENLQARLRGMTVMALSNKHGHLALTTGNKSELAVGYCTLYGDMCGGLAVIGDAPKQLVYDIAHHFNRDGEVIPGNTLTKPPSAELAPDQKDEDSLPPYAILDAVLKAFVEQQKSVAEIVEMGFEEETVTRVVHLIQNSEYKRQQAAPGLRITSKAFGVGRRIPIAKRNLY